MLKRLDPAGGCLGGGTGYLDRTAISKSSMYQNASAETQNNLRALDNEGKPLDGINHYTVTCAKGQVPPVKGFWSLTLCNDEKFALGVVDDRWFQWVTGFGLTGPDRGEGDKYLFVPPPSLSLLEDGAEAPADGLDVGGPEHREGVARDLSPGEPAGGDLPPSPPGRRRRTRRCAARGCEPGAARAR